MKTTGKATASVLLCVLIASMPAFSKTHKDDFPVPCATLWTAIKTTVRSSGKYIVVSIDETDMSASYSMGSIFTSKRVNSVSLAPVGDHCEMATQTAFSGFVNNDAEDFKKRVEQYLAKPQ